MSKKEEQNEKLDDLDKMGGEGEFDSFLSEDEKAEHQEPASLDFLRHLPIKLTVEVDSVGITIRDLLNSKPGEVLELNKQVGEPMDIFANGEPFGKAEVVVVDNKYGIRLLEVFGQADKNTKTEDS